MAYQLLITVLVTLAAIAVIRFENSGKASPRRRQYTGKTAQHSHFSGNSFGVPFVNATYDYVVIGGGTAGLAVAWKLATGSSASVAVVEAGSFYQLDNGNGSVIPALTPHQHIGWDPDDVAPLIDWDYVTEPQAGLSDRRLYYARGKTMGGSSARAHGAFMRGTKGSYNEWAARVGDATYEYQNLLPFFQQSSNLTAPDTRKRWPTNGTVQYDVEAYATDRPGPLQISWPNWAVPLGSWAALAFEGIGLPRSEAGFSSGALQGSGWVPGTIDPVTAHRSSSQTSFWEAAADRTSIKAYTRTLAQRILFDSRKRATAVVVITEGRSYHLSARKEIILSAGAFNSPQLLMLSGIGPEQELRSHNIPIVQHVPGVGKNLHDKTYVGVAHRVNVETSSAMINSPVHAAAAVSDYLNNQTGPLTNGPAFVAFERFSDDVLTPSARQKLAHELSDDWPHVEYLVENGFSGDNRNYATADPKDGFNYATISAALQGSLSRGEVRLRSSNPSDPPSINPDYLRDPVDVELAVASFKRVREIWKQMVNVSLGEEYYPGEQAVSDDGEILEYIRTNSIQMWHASGTCQMGSREDAMAVVDSQARVIGVEGLRVVDASIFPFLPPGHPLATVYALALKIGTSILGQNA
ncbi:unnamed protein product [Cercospora beticola]|nr:unnamed protein product [Cercospora beticola]